MWYDDAALTNSIGSGNPLTLLAPTVTTTYYVRFEGECDSSSAVSTTVNVLTLSTAPVSASSNMDSVCPGEGTVILSYVGGMLGDGAVAVWYDNASLTNNIGTGNFLSITAPISETTYFVRFENECNITSAVSTTVSTYIKPTPVFVEKDENVCVDDNLYRYVVAGQAGSIYAWSITGGTIVSDYGDSVLVDWGDVPGVYQISVTETSIRNCSSEPLILDVRVGQPTVDLGESRTLCYGQTVTITPTGNFSFQQWHDLSTGMSYTADTTEMVSITVYDDFGCTAEDSVQVTAFPTPVVDLGNDTTLCGEMSLILDAGNPGSTYLWSTGDLSQQIVVYAGEQFISVEVTNQSGCTGNDEIHIQPCSPEAFFAGIANTITPNGDNMNDTWQIDEAMAYPEIEIEIFNRWGQLVWRSSRGYTENWDGRDMQGKEMPMDSYFYVINLNDGSEPISGVITVVR